MLTDNILCSEPLHEECYMRDQCLRYDICPMVLVEKLLFGKWKILILWYLSYKTLRFSDIKKRLPQVTQKMLTTQLRALEKDKLIYRKVYPVVPPKVEYGLTETGHEILPILKLMHSFGSGYLNNNLFHKDKSDNILCSEPLHEECYMRNQCLRYEVCPMVLVEKLLFGKWKILILWYLSYKPLRFSDIKKRLPQVTEKMITMQLRSLEKDKLIYRKVYPVVPSKVEYGLTGTGHEILPILKIMHSFGSGYLNNNLLNKDAADILAEII